jgi:hypothetical protein
MMAAVSVAVAVDAAAVDAVDAESRPGASLEDDLASGVGFTRGGSLGGASASTPAVAETSSEDRTVSEVTADEIMPAVLAAMDDAAAAAPRSDPHERMMFEVTADDMEPAVLTALAAMDEQAGTPTARWRKLLRA